MEDKRGFCVIWTWVILFVVTTLAHEALAGDTKKGEYVYFTQGKNIANLNTQLPAQKGLLKKREEGVVSIGKYQEKTKAPRTRLDINVEIKMEKNVLTVSYTVDPGTMQINHRIPIHQQLFQEAVSETHVYLVFPRKLILSNEIQTIHAIDNTTEKQMSLFASFSEDTKLSGLLRKYNASMEGTYELTKDERTQLERAFDNTASVAGKYGKIAKAVKTGIKYGIKKQEQKRIRKLQKKYGDNYLVYKMPFYVPEGISMAYSHIGRVSTFFMDASMLDGADKIYVEFPKLSFEMNVTGAIRRASLERLTYEVDVAPVRDVDEPIISMEKYARQVFESIKNKNKEKIIQIGYFSKEDVIDYFYLHSIRESRTKDFVFPHMSQEKMDAWLKSLHSKYKNKLEETLAKLSSLKEKMREESFENVENFYLSVEKQKIDLSKAKYLHCFYYFPDDLYVVFTYDAKKYVFLINTTLFSSGWKSFNVNISEPTTAKYYLLELLEANADIFPGNTKNEMDIIRSQLTQSIFNEMERSWNLGHGSSEKISTYISQDNIYDIFRDYIKPHVNLYDSIKFKFVAELLDGWNQRIKVKLSHVIGGIVLTSSGPDKKMNTTDDVSKVIAVNLNRKSDDICEELPQREANMINKDLLKRMFLECQDNAILKTIALTGKFSRSELIKMARQSKHYPFSFVALHRINIVSWEMTYKELEKSKKIRRPIK
ncbi:MAG TPA: hypothetical protein ENI63_01515 [Candidatus Kaiserbacteria bacterium]|nr:hypothetical protein [Candidatus Kaiserbacteria bacterium]